MRLIDLDDYSHTFCGYDGEYEKWNIDPDVTVPINPEPKKGKWRRMLVDSGFNADWHCSECGWRTSLEEHGYNFCPNCGCRMTEGGAT